MWYAIIGGIGLFTGIGLLVWGILERKKRYDAEKQALKYGAKVNNLKHQLTCLEQAVKILREHEIKLKDQTMVLKNTIAGLRKRLLACKDHKTIAEWLDAEMEDNSV